MPGTYMTLVLVRSPAPQQPPSGGPVQAPTAPFRWTEHTLIGTTAGGAGAPIDPGAILTQICKQHGYRVVAMDLNDAQDRMVVLLEK